MLAQHTPQATSTTTSTVNTAPRESRASGWRIFDEADELARSIQGAQLRITPKERAPGAWALMPLALERGFVQFVDEPCAALTHGVISRDVAGFGVALASAGGYCMNGHPVSGNVFAMFGPGAAHFASSSGPTRWAAV